MLKWETHFEERCVIVLFVQLWWRYRLKKNISKDCQIDHEDNLLSAGFLLRFLWLRLRKKEVRVAKELNVQNYMSS